MAFSDPQSITLTSGAVSLPRTASGVNTGSFTANDGTSQLVVASTGGNTKRVRRSFRLNASKIVTDPLASDRNIPVSMSVYLVVDMPPTGFSVADATDQVKALMGNLSASTYANLAKLLGGEN